MALKAMSSKDLVFNKTRLASFLKSFDFILKELCALARSPVGVSLIISNLESQVNKKDKKKSIFFVTKINYVETAFFSMLVFRRNKFLYI